MHCKAVQSKRLLPPYSTSGLRPCPEVSFWLGFPPLRSSEPDPQWSTATGAGQPYSSTKQPLCLLPTCWTSDLWLDRFSTGKKFLPYTERPKGFFFPFWPLFECKNRVFFPARIAWTYFTELVYCVVAKTSDCGVAFCLFCSPPVAHNILVFRGLIFFSSNPIIFWLTIQTTGWNLTICSRLDLEVSSGFKLRRAAG